MGEQPEKIVIGINNGNVGGSNNQVTNSFGNSFNQQELSSMIEQLRSELLQSDLSEEKKREANECIDEVEYEVVNHTPRKFDLKCAVETLKKIAVSDSFQNILNGMIQVLIAGMQK